jgi:hypothetical protein
MAALSLGSQEDEDTEEDEGLKSGELQDIL